MAVVRDGGELARVALLHAGADQVTSADVGSEALRAMIRTLLRGRLGRPGPQGWPDPRTIDLDASRQSAQIGKIERRGDPRGAHPGEHHGPGTGLRLDRTAQSRP
jgi:DNA-binding response OmpR family regulator